MASIIASGHSGIFTGTESGMYIHVQEYQVSPGITLMGFLSIILL